MDTKERRKAIHDYLAKSEGPVTGTKLAQKFSVSRQIIVGDINVIKASGVTIFATSRGYIMPASVASDAGRIVNTITSRHSDEDVRRELEIIVDNGGSVRDVTVEHPVYGQINADLMLGNRHEVEVFMNKLQNSKGKLLSAITDGVHHHTIEAPDEEAMQRIICQLKDAGFIEEE